MRATTLTTFLIARISKNHLRLHFLLEKMGRKYSLSGFGFFAQLFKQKIRTQLDKKLFKIACNFKKFLVLKFFLNQGITAKFLERTQITTNFSERTKSA